MRRKGFDFNRSLNPNLSSVEHVFDDLTKSSVIKQQHPENTKDNDSSSDIVTSIVSDISSNIKNNTITSINSHKISSIDNDISTNIENIIPSNLELSINSYIDSEIAGSLLLEEENNFINDNSNEANKRDKGNDETEVDSSSINEKEGISVRNLSKWHTEAEQKLYRILYNQTIVLERNNWYFSFSELARKTKFKSKITIAVAIDGLAAKKSIDILTDKRGDHLGKRYKVYTPSEILFRRKEDNIKIDPQTKKIVNE